MPEPNEAEVDSEHNPHRGNWYMAGSPTKGNHNENQQVVEDREEGNDVETQLSEYRSSMRDKYQNRVAQDQQKSTNY